MEHGSHVVFYRQEPGGILVSRILHRRMLPERQAIDSEDEPQEYSRLSPVRSIAAFAAPPRPGRSTFSTLPPRTARSDRSSALPGTPAPPPGRRASFPPRLILRVPGGRQLPRISAIHERPALVNPPGPADDQAAR
jgi:hypothetical protein